MGFGLLVAAIGLVLLMWPKPAVAIVKLYRSGSVLSLNAPAQKATRTHQVEMVGRAVGGALMIGGVVLALAVS